jgi:type I restriction enzyme S subunit
MKKTFDEVFEDKTRYGTKIKTDEYHTNGKYLIIDQGQEEVAGYTDLEEGVFTDVPVIIFGDHTRKIKYVDEPFFLGADGVKVLKSKFKDANYKYLYYVLKNAKIPNTGYNRHFKWLKEVKIEYPDSAKQEDIVIIFDKMTRLISLQQKELQCLDDLIKSRFVEMFGDPVSNSKRLSQMPLSELGELGRGVSKHRPRNAPELLGGIYPLIQTGEVADADLYITSYKNTYSELGFQQSKMWSKGTLCITIAANIAKTAILSFDACFPDSVVGFNANEKTCNIFIHYWFSFFQAILESQAPESAQKNINLKILSDLMVIVPPIELQQQFVDFVAQVNKYKLHLRKYKTTAEKNNYI